MRLLKCNTEGNAYLTEEFFNCVPPYAILSHRWGSEEVTFKDLSDGTGSKKTGFAKLEFCAKQARRNDLHYFWIDTCCIDKSSSTELSEAINSMFRWYREAARCYVYLSDVSGDTQSSDWQKDFSNSTWFTRGWTLQELIAPSSVEFFSRDGAYLGNKSSLEPCIESTTNIPLNALRGCPLSNFSIPERMSWVRSRETTREEDMAYSLLGIFDIHMPLLYGEGRKKAFGRLEEEIKKSSKQEILAEGNGLDTAMQEIPTHAVESSEPTSGPVDQSEEENKAKLAMLGMTKQRFYRWIPPVAVLVVLGVIAGVVVSVLKGRRRQDKSLNVLAKNILSTSQLAATNFTTGHFDLYYLRTVFFQDTYSNLIARRFNATTYTWQTFNLSGIMFATAQPLDVLPGTALASAACVDWNCGNTNVYFLTSDNKINAMTETTTTAGGAGWTGMEEVRQANITTWSGSKLAAAYNANSEANVQGNFVVAYQDQTSSITVVNDTKPFSRTQISVLSPVVSRTNLAIVPQPHWSNNTSYRLSGMSLAAEPEVLNTEGSLQTSNYANSDWTMGETVTGSIPLTAQIQGFAITTLNNWADTLYLALLSTGIITGWVFGENNKTIPSISLVGGPAVNFSTIATTYDGRLYGIWNDSVLEYSFDPSDPSSLNYIGVVYP